MAQPPSKTQPDESPTMVLPVLGVISQWSAKRLIVSVAGAIALIIAGLLLLNVLIPADGKKSTAKNQTHAALAPPRNGNTSVIPASGKYQPLDEMCSRIDFTPLEDTFPPATTTPTTATAHSVGCKAEFEFVATTESAPASASTSPKPSQRRIGALEIKTEYFSGEAKALDSYSSKIANPAVKLLEGVGEQAGAFTSQRQKWANVRLYVLDDNVVITLAGTAIREDHPWTDAELDALRDQYARVVEKTLENFRMP